MQENLKLIRVFIGSPGGLDEERQAAHAVVKEVNQYNSDHWNSLFKLMGWEEAIPGYRRAQDKINEDLDRCDYFIGVMWDKWGSKPSTDPHGHTSGFEEEYSRSTTRIESGLMKDMAMFFKKVEVPPGMEPGAEIKKVLNFRQKCIDEKKVFFRDFTSVESFKDAVRAKLMEIGWLEYKSRKSSTGKPEQEDRSPLAEIETEITSPTSSRLIDVEAQDFISKMLQKPADLDAVEPQEIARFRLISTSVSRSGNDESHLGTHDANLVFRHYREASLSDQELLALIVCGVVGFSHQNVPLWRWLAKADMGVNYLYRLRILATVGSDEEKVGAIRILQSLNQPLPTHDGYFNKTGVLTDWLSESAATRVLDAVVSFLGSNGSEDDIPLIEQASAGLPPYKKSKVDVAIVEIISRRSFEDALARICEHSVSNVESALAQRLLSKSRSLTTSTLKLCLSAASDTIRIGAAKVLYERGEIDEDSADNLLTDESAEMRLIAAEALRRSGKELAEDVLEKALKTQRTGSLGLFSYSNSGPDTTQLEIYRANRRAELSVSQLLQEAEGDFLRYKYLVTLFNLNYSAARSQIREGLRSNFSGYFEKSTAGFRDKHSADVAALNLMENTIPSIRQKLYDSAVCALCRLNRSEDLALIRQCMDSLPIEADEIILRFLSHFGDWKDVDRILKLGRNEKETRSVLAIDTISFPRERAAALLSVSKNRIADLLTLELDARIRTSILKQVPKSAFVSLPDDLILRELAHPNSDCRAIVAMRCVQAFSKARVGALLNRYTSNAHYRFYNSIHWLDLGVSLPSKLSKSVAERELTHR